MLLLQDDESHQMRSGASSTASSGVVPGSRDYQSRLRRPSRVPAQRDYPLLPASILCPTSLYDESTELRARSEQKGLTRRNLITTMQCL